MCDKELTFKEFVQRRSVKVLSFIMLLCLVINACRCLRTGIYITEDLFLPKKSSTYYGDSSFEVKIDKLRSGTKYQFVYGEDTRSLTLYFEAEKAIATFSNGKKISGYLIDGELVDGSGTPLYSNNDIYIASEEEYNNSFPADEYDMALFATKAYKGEIENFNSPIFLVFPLIVFVIGMFALYFPNRFHFFGSRWRYEDAELSEEGIASEKLTGVLCVLGGYILTFLINIIVF